LGKLVIKKVTFCQYLEVNTQKLTFLKVSKPNVKNIVLIIIAFELPIFCTKDCNGKPANKALAKQSSKASFIEDL
jgi:hypothetical protein